MILTWRDILDDYKNSYPLLYSLTEDYRPYDYHKITVLFNKNLHMDPIIYNYDSKQISNIYKE